MSTSPLTQLCLYRYDPLDRLTSQLQPDAPAHQRFYCKSRLATEIQGAIGLSVFQNNDFLLAQRKNQGGAVESTLLATDLQRSVLLTLKKDHLPQPIAYSPYGHRPALSGLLSLLGFNGERPDPVTGHYLLGNGYRAFNPVLMRFNSPDSWSPFGKGGLNCYMYCGGDPLNRSDKTGHWYEQLLKAIKHMLPGNTYQEVSRALGKAMVDLPKPDELGRMAATSNNSTYDLLFMSTISDHTHKIRSKLGTLSALNSAIESPEKTAAILNAKNKIQRSIRVVRALNEKIPGSHQNPYYESFVLDAERVLDPPPAYSEIAQTPSASARQIRSNTSTSNRPR